MNCRRHFLLQLMAAVTGLAACITAVASADTATTPPNLLILVADDLGYRDVSFNGGDIPTPAIDRIAQ